MYKSNLFFARKVKIKDSNKEGVIISNVGVGMAYITPQYLVVRHDGTKEWFMFDKLELQEIRPI